MKKQPEEKKQSRRDFTKSVAATLISAPIAASIVSCKSEGPPNQNAAPSPVQSPGTTTSSLPRVETCVTIPSVIEDHIPPMEIGDGSLAVETGHDLGNQPEQIQTPNNPRKWRYTLTGTTVQYGNIAAVQPLLELDKYWDSRLTYMLQDQPSTLKLWLQQWDQSANSWKQPPPAETDEPHIIVKGKAKSVPDPNYESLVIEMDEKFSKKSTNNHGRKRPFKHERQFGTNDDQYRIYRWAIVDANNQVITVQGQAFRGSLADDPRTQGFRFLIRFFDND